MDKILNLTQHSATPDQLEAGVVEPHDKELVKSLLDFNVLPSTDDIRARATELANYANASSGLLYAMIGGAPFLMSKLEERLINRGIQPLYAFSVRESVDSVQEDGSTKKTSVFKHGGFVKA